MTAPVDIAALVADLRTNRVSAAVETWLRALADDAERAT